MCSCVSPILHGFLARVSTSPLRRGGARAVRVFCLVMPHCHGDRRARSRSRCIFPTPLCPMKRGHNGFNDPANFAWPVGRPRTLARSSPPNALSRLRALAAPSRGQSAPTGLGLVVLQALGASSSTRPLDANRRDPKFLRNWAVVGHMLRVDTSQESFDAVAHILASVGNIAFPHRQLPLFGRRQYPLRRAAPEPPCGGRNIQARVSTFRRHSRGVGARERYSV